MKWNQAGNANSPGVVCNSYTSQSIKHSLIAVIFNSATKSAEIFCLKRQIQSLALGYVHPVVSFFTCGLTSAPWLSYLGNRGVKAARIAKCFHGMAWNALLSKCSKCTLSVHNHRGKYAGKWEFYRNEGFAPLYRVMGTRAVLDIVTEKSQGGENKGHWRITGENTEKWKNQ